MWRRVLDVKRVPPFDGATRGALLDALFAAAARCVFLWIVPVSTKPYGTHDTSFSVLTIAVSVEGYSQSIYAALPQIYIYIYIRGHAMSSMFFFFSLLLFYCFLPPLYCYIYQSINAYTISCWKHLWRWWCPLMHIVMQIIPFHLDIIYKTKIIKFYSNLNSNNKKIYYYDGLLLLI